MAGPDLTVGLEALNPSFLSPLGWGALADQEAAEKDLEAYQLVGKINM